MAESEFFATIVYLISGDSGLFCALNTTKEPLIGDEETEDCISTQVEHPKNPEIFKKAQIFMEGESGPDHVNKEVSHAPAAELLDYWGFGPHSTIRCGINK